MMLLLKKRIIHGLFSYCVEKMVQDMMVDWEWRKSQFTKIWDKYFFNQDGFFRLNVGLRKHDLMKRMSAN